MKEFQTPYPCQSTEVTLVRSWFWPSAVWMMTSLALEGVENTNWCVSAFSVAVPDTTCIVQSPPVLATAPVSVAPAPAVTESGPPCALVTSIVSVQLAPCRVLKSPTAPGTVRSAPWNLAM